MRAAKSRCRYARRCFTTRRRLSGLAYRGADVFGGKNWTLLNCGDWSTGPSFWQLARAHIGVALARAVPRSGPIFYPYGRSQPLVDRLHRMAGSFLKEASAIAEGDMPGGNGTESQPTTLSSWCDPSTIGSNDFTAEAPSLRSQHLGLGRGGSTYSSLSPPPPTHRRCRE